jgi:glutaredoxin
MGLTMKVFTQPTCPKCPAAKKVVAQVEDKFAVEQYDIKTEDGLTEALEYDVMSTPSIVILDKNKVVAEWRGQSPTVEELMKVHK